MTRRARILLLVLVALGGYAVWQHVQPRPHPTSVLHAMLEPEPTGDWEVHTRFLGRVVGMSLEGEKVPTLPVGYDPRYQMKVEVLTIREGSLPVKPRGYVAFQIHSPSLFFMRYLGRKPTTFEGYIEGPFEFTILRRPFSDGRFVYDLRIDPSVTTPPRSPHAKD